MKVIIHRGTHQIGGCIAEIQTNQAKILIDFGMELDHGDVSEGILIEGVTTGKESVEGIFFTHYHGDHIGLYNYVLPEIPLYMGKATKEIFLVLQKRMNNFLTERIEKAITFSVGVALWIKDIKITPFLVDHSAYDSYMFLIEADGKRVLHTGDFRVHGFRGKGLYKTIEKYIGKIDLLIIEGTTLSRPETKMDSERDLVQKAKKVIMDNKYVFVLCSSTNIDRIAGMYSATPQGKYFICDSYQKEIIDIAKKYGKEHSTLYAFDKALVYGDNLLSKLIERGFCMLIRNNTQFKEIIDKFDKEKSMIIYSMWDGYLEDSKTKLKNFLLGKRWMQLHTSGHASQEDIETVCNLLEPKIGIIPIHTTSVDSIENMNLNYSIIRLSDGEILDL